MLKGIASFFATASLARTLVIIAFIVLLFLIIYWWRSSRKKREQDQQFKNDFELLTNQGGQGGQQPSYLSTNYTQFADKIYEAGCSGVFCYGTDEDAINKVFEQMQNDLDVLLL